MQGSARITVSKILGLDRLFSINSLQPSGWAVPTILTGTLGIQFLKFPLHTVFDIT